RVPVDCLRRAPHPRRALHAGNGFLITPDPFAGSEASPFGRRQRRPRGARPPVTVVTGSLGSGKTTLIRELLTKPEAANTAVIVNEFGEVGIDDALLRSSS